MLRIAGSLAAGAVAAFVTIWLLEAVGHTIFPPPPTMNPNDPASIAQHFPMIPMGAKLMVVFAWFVGALDGGIVARLLRGPAWAPWAIAGLLVVMCLITLAMIPHPLWMKIAGIAAPLLGGFIATRVPLRVSANG